MKITATASGGFTGRIERVELDTACRADGQAIEAMLAALLADSDSAAAAAAVPAACIGADLRHWKITADDGDQCRTLVLVEDGGPAFSGWQALLARLRTYPQDGV